MHRAIELALQAEAEGNLPIGSVVVLDGKIIAEGRSRLLVPHFHPGHHAETEALKQVSPELWTRRHEMTCYTTLEPCVMCTGTLILHGLGRVVFGGYDTKGGGRFILPHLPPYYENGQGVPSFEGPLLPDLCDPLYERAKIAFAQVDV